MKHERIHRDHDTNLLRVIACFFVVLIHTSYPDGALAAAMGVYTGVQSVCSRRGALGGRRCRLLQELAGCTLGIYLLHPAVILALQNNFKTGGLPAALIPVRAFAVFIFCGAIVWLLRKIPILRWPVL